MPQGIWLGPRVLLILMNDLRTTEPTFKFIDDVTVIEVADRLDKLVKWRHQLT
jgi:hypothetical protein